MPLPKFNLLPSREYTLDGVIFRYTPYTTPAMERKSRTVLAGREGERIDELITRCSWFAITEMEYEGEITTPDEISLDPGEALEWASNNIPYRVFMEISRTLDMGDYPLGQSTKMDENGVPQMTVWNFLVTTLPLYKELTGSSMMPSLEEDQQTNDSSEPLSATE